MLETTPLERMILNDIVNRTGMSFPKLGGIDTRNKQIADAILPILTEWVSKIDDARHRTAIYHRFHTPYAQPYFDQLVRWWITECDEMALAFLTPDLALLVRCEDAERVWKLCQDLPHRPFHYMLVSRLATCASVEREAKNALVKGLESGTLRAGDLSYIAKVKDPRILRWFQTQVNSTDPNIRVVAKRVANQGKRWPRGLIYSNLPPERTLELFSTEENVQNVQSLLQRIASDFNLKIPAGIASGAFLLSAEINRWIVTHISSSSGNQACLWFRMEDIDTVEVVLSRPNTLIGNSFEPE